MIRSITTLVATLAVTLAVTATSAHAAGWLPSQVALASGTSDYLPYSVGSNARGDVAVAWADPASSKIMWTERPAGGVFTPAAELTEGGTSLGAAVVGDVQIDAAGTINVFAITGAPDLAAVRPRVATKAIGAAAWTTTPLAAANATDPAGGYIGGRVMPDGRAIAVWQQFHLDGGVPNPALTKLEYARRAAGSATWSSKNDVPGGAGTTSGHDVALSSAGYAAIAFLRTTCAPAVPMAFAAAQEPTGAWSTATQVSACDPAATRGDVDGVDVEVTDGGKGTVVWDHLTSDGYAIQVADHPAGVSPWAGPAFGERIGLGGNPDIALSPDGAATVAWSSSQGVFLRTRPAGSSTFAAQQQLTDLLTSRNRLSLTAAPDGSMFAAWDGTLSGNSRIAGTYRAPGASTFAAPVVAPQLGAGFPVVARDDEGNSAAIWMQFSSPTITLTASAFDPAPPVIAGITLPDSATAGVAFGFGATVSDRWSIPSGGWAFGDGTTGAVSGTKTYAAVGDYPATLTVSDATGNVATTSRSTHVIEAAAGGGPGPCGGGGGGTADTVKPVLSGVSLSRSVFRVDVKGASVPAAKKGTTIRYSLSEAATVRFTVRRLVPGRRVGTSCRKPSRSNRRRKACTRKVSAGSFTQRSAAAGAVRKAFSGRVKGKALVTGRYELRLVATDGAGNRSAAKELRFRVVRR